MKSSAECRPRDTIFLAALAIFMQVENLISVSAASVEPVIVEILHLQQSAEASRRVCLKWGKPSNNGGTPPLIRKNPGFERSRQLRRGLQDCLPDPPLYYRNPLHHQNYFKSLQTKMGKGLEILFGSVMSLLHSGSCWG